MRIGAPPDARRLKLGLTVAPATHSLLRSEFTTSEDEHDVRDSLRHRVILVDSADRYDPHFDTDRDGGPGFIPPVGQSDSQEPNYDWNDDPCELEYREMRAQRAVDLRVLFSKLTYSANHAALLTATCPSTLHRAVDKDLANRLSLWPTLTLPKRHQEVLTW